MSPWSSVPTQNHTFVPVNHGVKITEEPTFHDRLPVDAERFTGAIYCTMTCLTPTLAGHYRYPARDTVDELRNSVADAIRHVCPALANEQDLERQKTIIEPLTLPGDLTNPGEVLISGDAIKSAIFRQPIQSLLNAPMERVAERRIAYRVFSPTDTAMGLYCVKFADYADPNHPTVQLSKLDATKVLWPRAGVADRLLQMARGSEYPHRPFSVAFGTNLPNTFRMVANNGYPLNILADGSGNYQLSENYLLYHYGGNLDGQFELGRRFNGIGNHYKCLLVGGTALGDPYDVNPMVLRRFGETIDFLSDPELGHLAGHPLVTGKEDAIQLSRQMRTASSSQSKQLKVGELVWAEASGGEIRSFGRWRSYFWEYRDSVLHRQDAQTGNKRLRNELSPLPCEKKAASDGTEFQLTAGRLFHGFVVTSSNRRPSDPLTEEIGSSMTGLAGRVHVNLAKEVISDGEQSNRFVGGIQRHYCVLGRPVGTAKVSSAEIYLLQKQFEPQGGETRQMKTWGELDNDQLSAGLAGRKMYPHAKPQYSFDPMRDIEDGSNLSNSVTGLQVPILRLISNEGVQFRFRVQVENLRLWEFGALLFAISSERIDARKFLLALGCTTTTELRAAIQKYQTQERVTPSLDWIFDDRPAQDGDCVPDFASKIGYQRQRGMGSVELQADAIEKVSFDSPLPVCSQFETQELETAKAEFYKKVASLLDMSAKADLLDTSNRAKAERHKVRMQYIGGVLAPWLDARQYRLKSNVTRNYRRDAAGSTLGYHKAVREEHRENRQRGYQ